MRSVLAGLGLLALAAAMPASAADLRPRGPMPYKSPAYVAGFNWTGFYIGVERRWRLGAGDAFGGSLDVTAASSADSRLQLAGRRFSRGCSARSDSAWAGSTVRCRRRRCCHRQGRFGSQLLRHGPRSAPATPSTPLLYATGGLAWRTTRSASRDHRPVHRRHLGEQHQYRRDRRRRRRIRHRSQPLEPHRIPLDS